MAENVCSGQRKNEQAHGRTYGSVLRIRSHVPDIAGSFCRHDALSDVYKRQGTACHVNGADRILGSLCEELKIKDGETTEDGLFSIKSVACLGCCSLSPVMMIGDETYGSLTPEKAIGIINELKAKEAAK